MDWLEILMLILIILFVGGIVAWRVVVFVRKKKGKTTKSASACGCGCSGCAASGGCPSAAKQSYYGSDTDEAMPEINVQSEVTCDFSDVVKAMNKDAAKK